MKNVLVPTKNVQRYSAAVKALEGRLRDREVQGMGLICGRPGLGKTMFVDSYYVRSRRDALVRVIKVRAQGIWTESSMLKYILAALDQAPTAYRKDAMFDQLERTLSPDPAIIIIDEIDAISGSRRLISLLKDIHDMTGSSILMVGEERVDALLRRHESFYNRINQSAFVHVTVHSAADITDVIGQRCEFRVDGDVCVEIHRTLGKSMRSVLDRIREIEAFCRTNRLERVSMRDYQAMTGQLRTPVRAAAESVKRAGLSVVDAGAPTAEG